jgi:hypothetical protein
MSEIKDILESKLKPREKVSNLFDAIIREKISFQEFFEFFKVCSNVEKGTCADVMKHISADNPEFFKSCIEDLIEYINYNLPRIKWGVQETIGNISRKFPDRVEKAIPNLLLNTKDDSTVVRWCAAFALTEIAKNNPKTREKLSSIFSEIVEKEKNNGVRNVYIKALNIIRKE